MVANCVSNPSLLTAGGTAMIPALHISTSSRSWANLLVVALTEARDNMSMARKVVPTAGSIFLISAVRASPASALRPVKYIWAGLWRASVIDVDLPKPAVPGYLVWSVSLPVWSGAGWIPTSRDKNHLAIQGGDIFGRVIVDQASYLRFGRHIRDTLWKSLR